MRIVRALIFVLKLNDCVKSVLCTQCSNSFGGLQNEMKPDTCSSALSLLQPTSSRIVVEGDTQDGDTSDSQHEHEHFEPVESV